MSQTRHRISRTYVVLMQVGLVVLLLAAWQWLPTIGALRSASVAFDPFFISSPSKVFHRLIGLMFGSESGGSLLWANLFETLKATFLGVAAGTVLGLVAGLVLSNNATLERVLNPFVAMFNSMPRIALVPIFVILAGPTTTATALTVLVVVFFLVFYSAFAGGRSVPRESVQNAWLLGGTSLEIMRHVRLPYVIVWTVLSLPNAISFGLVGAVTAEILTGQVGIGALLLQSISAVDSTLTFSVVVLLSAVGVILVKGTEFGLRRSMHWWEAG
jgi:NitT/TauT family transport system permease protein